MFLAYLVEMFYCERLLIHSTYRNVACDSSYYAIRQSLVYFRAIVYIYIFVEKTRCIMVQSYS